MHARNEEATRTPFQPLHQALLLLLQLLLLLVLVFGMEGHKTRVPGTRGPTKKSCRQNTRKAKRQIRAVRPPQPPLGT